MDWGKCERCGGQAPVTKEGPFAGSRQPLDYCANCSKNLCPNCMANGCCGKKPAESGMKADHGDET